MTCTNGGWSVSTTTGSNIEGAILDTRRQLGGSWDKALHPQHPNFPNSDAAFAYALEHGFTQVYYARPNGFIDLRLSPATRRYLRSKSVTEVWTLLPKILSPGWVSGTYFRSVKSKKFMQATRDRWMDAIYTRGGRHHPTRK